MKIKNADSCAFFHDFSLYIRMCVASGKSADVKEKNELEK